MRPDSRSSRITPPRSLAPTPAHAQPHSYPNPIRVQAQPVSPFAGAHSHGAAQTPSAPRRRSLARSHLDSPPRVTPAEGTRQPPSKYLQHTLGGLGLHWDPDRLSCRSGRGVGNPELLKAPKGGLRAPSAGVYWKKERKIKNSNRCESARARFLWGSAPVRARGQGLREGGGNSNFKRNLSPSESDGRRFPLKIQFGILWG